MIPSEDLKVTQAFCSKMYGNEPSSRVCRLRIWFGMSTMRKRRCHLHGSVRTLAWSYEMIQPPVPDLAAVVMKGEMAVFWSGVDTHPPLPLIDSELGRDALETAASGVPPRPFPACSSGWHTQVQDKVITSVMMEILKSACPTGRSVLQAPIHPSSPRASQLTRRHGSSNE